MRRVGRKEERRPVWKDGRKSKDEEREEMGEKDRKEGRVDGRQLG